MEKDTAKRYKNSIKLAGMHSSLEVNKQKKKGGVEELGARMERSEA